MSVGQPKGMKRQQLPDLVPTGFPCPMEGCNKVLSQSGSRLRHIRAVHQESEATLIDLLRADGKMPKRTKKNTDRRFPCVAEGCTCSYTQSQTLMRHIRTGHKENKEELLAILKAQKAKAKEAAKAAKENQVFLCNLGACNGRRFGQKKALNRHVRRNHTERRYECKTCGAKFPEQNDLNRHMKNHNPDTQECPVCLKSVRDLARHMKNRHGERQQCPHCPTTLKGREGLLEHIRLRHPSTPCSPECDLTFSKHGDRNLHVATEHKFLPSTPGMCNQCGELPLNNKVNKRSGLCVVCRGDMRRADKIARAFTARAKKLGGDLPALLRKTRSEDLWTKPKRTVEVRSPNSSLWLRVVTRTEEFDAISTETLKICERAEDTKKRNNRLFRGIQVVLAKLSSSSLHPSLLNPILDAAIASLNALVLDKGSKDFFRDGMVTSFLLLEFSDVSRSKAIVPRENNLLSNAERSFECDCSPQKTFHYLSALEYHVQKSHTDARPFDCKDCGKSFATEGGLAQHSETHREKDLKCPDCTKMFKSKRAVAQHLLYCRRIKHHSCTECDLTFKVLKDFNRHTASHSEHRPFKCPVPECKRAFKTNVQLTQHGTFHSEDRPYVCEACGDGFKTNGSLKDHRVAVHAGIRRYECRECGDRFFYRGSWHRHEKMHVTQSAWKFPCTYAFMRLEKCQSGMKPCRIRCETQWNLDHHIQAAHTKDGLKKKKLSEDRLAKFFDDNKVQYTRDWENLVRLKGTARDSSGTFARPDFHLTAASERLGAIVLVGNDEFAHRTYSNDFQRTNEMSRAILQTHNFGKAGCVRAFQSPPL